MKQKIFSVNTMKRKIFGGTLIGVFIGLVLGMASSAVVVWLTQKIPNPFNRNEKIENIVNTNTKAPSGVSQSIISLAGKPGDIPNPLSSIITPLPNSSTEKKDGPDVVEDIPVGKIVEPPAINKIPGNTGNNYFLQAGAFQSNDEANNQKARIALMGIDVKVITANLENNAKIFRIRVGPYSNIEEAEQIREDLNTAGISSMIVSSKESN